VSASYRIREVNGLEEDIAEQIKTMHMVCFGDTAPQVDPSEGWWWLASHKRHVIGFGALTVGSSDPNSGYLMRSGVLPDWRGQGLQRRLIRARETKARKLGFQYIVTDTTYNTPSSNSLIKAGYKLYHPKNPWGMKNTLYWRKELQ
jgi:GNAT superfamily N-acetyltransferase